MQSSARLASRPANVRAEAIGHGTLAYLWSAHQRQHRCKQSGACCELLAAAWTSEQVAGVQNTYAIKKTFA